MAHATCVGFYVAGSDQWVDYVDGRAEAESIDYDEVGKIIARKSYRAGVPVQPAAPN